MEGPGPPGLITRLFEEGKKGQNIPYLLKTMRPEIIPFEKKECIVTDRKIILQHPFDSMGADYKK